MGACARNGNSYSRVSVRAAFFMFTLTEPRSSTTSPVPSCGFLELPHESFGRGSRSGTVVPPGVKCSLSQACRMGVSCDNRYSAGELHDVDDTRNFPRRVFVIRDKPGILERWSDHHGEQHPWEAHVHSKHGLAGRLIVRVESL